AADRGTEGRSAPRARDLPARRRTGSPLSQSGAVRVAVPRRHRHQRHVRMVDLPGAGRRVGVDSALHHAHRLVLADPREEGAGARRHGPTHRGGKPVMSTPARRTVALDVGAIPEFAFGHRSILWWGTASMMVIEGMVFALVIVSYLYLKGR